MCQKIEYQRSKINDLQKEVMELKNVSTAAYQVVLGMKSKGEILPRPFDLIEKFDPCEKMERFRKLISIGKCLGEDDFDELINSFDITETKYGTTCAYKGVSKEQYDAIVDEKNDYFRHSKTPNK